MDNTKVCSNCKIKQDVSCFHKQKSTKDGLRCWCKTCRKQERKDNAEKNSIYQKQYRKCHIEERAKYSKQYRKRKAKKLLAYGKQCYWDDPGKKSKYNKQYYVDNKKRCLENKRRNCKNYALFETYALKLKLFEKTRHCPENLELLEVKCAYCGKWMLPTNAQVMRRLQAFAGIITGEQRFYCSENCKQSCPIYHKKLWPKGFKKVTSREVVPLLRQFVLERDNYTCQKCGATTETAQLHVHHEKSYTLNKIMANDPDNCITLCKDCHKFVHSQKGCKYSNLKCK